MNLINSVTFGMNFNFNNRFFQGGMNNLNNINIEDNDDDNKNEDFDFNDEKFEENENNEENEENDEDTDLFMRKREQFILELDEFQFKHLKKYSALKEDKCHICFRNIKA